jgi:hypothetical protein
MANLIDQSETPIIGLRARILFLTAPRRTRRQCLIGVVRIWKLWDHDEMEPLHENEVGERILDAVRENNRPQSKSRQGQVRHNQGKMAHESRGLS